VLSKVFYFLSKAIFISFVVDLDIRIWRWWRPTMKNTHAELNLEITSNRTTRLFAVRKVEFHAPKDTNWSVMLQPGDKKGFLMPPGTNCLIFITPPIKVARDMLCGALKGVGHTTSAKYIEQSQAICFSSGLDAVTISVI